MNKMLQKAMAIRGDTQQELAEYLGLRSYVSIHRKLYGYTGWSEDQAKKLCKRYKKTKEQLGIFI